MQSTMGQSPVQLVATGNDDPHLPKDDEVNNVAQEETCEQPSNELQEESKSVTNVNNHSKEHDNTNNDKSKNEKEEAEEEEEGKEASASTIASSSTTTSSKKVQEEKDNGDDGDGDDDTDGHCEDDDEVKEMTNNSNTTTNGVTKSKKVNGSESNGLGEKRRSSFGGDVDEGEYEDESVIADILRGNLDRYGFATTDYANEPSNSATSMARNRQTYVSKSETEKQRKKRVRLENLRTQKWLRMLANWDKQLSSKRKRLDRRVRKGIPDCFRDRAWPKLVAIHYNTDEEADTFEMLLANCNKSVDPEIEKIRECISRDIGRTFPRHIIFLKKGGIGQRALTNVLRAYASLDLKVGYCQGMGFIVGLLLGYVPERQSFAIFKALMLSSPWNMAEMYKPGMPGAQLKLKQYEHFLNLHLPNVAKHLEREMIVPSMYATQWFITVFTYNFPFDVVVRVWDIFLLEGWPIVFQVAIAIMKKNRHEILHRKFEHILEFFKGIPPALDPEEIMDLALTIPITQKQLQSIT